MKKGDIIEFDITKYAFEGKGIAKIQSETNNSEFADKNYIVFVHGSYPGDKVLAKISKIKKSYAEAIVTKIINPSPERITARCKYFPTCGGCKQQDMDYKSQLKYKKEQVIDLFERMGAFFDFEIEEIISSDKIFFYRNKMEYSFSNQRWLTKDEMDLPKSEIDFALGLHIPGMYEKVLDIDECFLQSEESNKILNLTREFFRSRNATIYTTKTHSGYLRNLVIKKSHHTNDLMVNLVTSEENNSLMKEYCEALLKTVPQITTIVNNINLKKSQTGIGDYEILFHGSGFICDTIGKYNFRISANSFFQTNTLQAEKLYNTAFEFAGLTGNEIVYDLYSGAGTISIFISDKAKEVYAFESVEAAVKDAEENNLLNNITNTHFITADLNKSFFSAISLQNIPYPDTIIVDPPRGGMNPITIKDILQLAPEKIVYISCNPATQVRDIKLLTESLYTLRKIQPVDMFPHTYHIENVGLLTKK